VNVTPGGTSASSLAPHAQRQAAPTIEFRSITKRFGATRALSDVSITIASGSIHGLVGENGAGKSTLGKILAGAVRPDRGDVLLDGLTHAFRSPRQALASGIAIISQEPVVVPARSVLENVFLGIEHPSNGMVSTHALTRRYEELCRDTGLDVPSHRAAGELRVADQQKVEILRAVARRARVIVMDEPTSALTVDESERLFALTRRLRASGTTIIYISHNLKDILQITDNVTVLRDGRVIRTAPAAAETVGSLVEAILGRPMELVFPEKRARPPDGAPVLRVRGLTRRGVLHDIDIDLHAGEILGLAGLIGSGRSELARALFGADPIDSGSVMLDGKPLRLRSPRQAIRSGIGMVPEDRKAHGIVPDRSIAENVTLAHIGAVTSSTIVSTRREQRAVAELAQSVGIPRGRGGAKVGELSGGNQQKVLFARWLFGRPRVLIIDEPTRGVDVGTKGAIYELIADVAADGTPVLLISSETEEILGLAHRVLVMRSGRIVATLSGDGMTESAIINAAFGNAVRRTAA
jgi:ABC-type sugar transport system ATPase subunit